MNPIDVDVEDVLSDVRHVLLERETGMSQSYRSEVRELEDIIYLLPGAWQNISNSLVALDQSATPLEIARPEEAVSLPGRALRAVKGFAKRIVLKTVYWYVNPVVAQLHSVQAATARATREVADQLRRVHDRLETIEKENLDGRVGALEGERFDDRIGRLERAWRHGDEPRSAGAVEREATAERISGLTGRETAAPASDSRPFHFDYYWFESIHRGDRALIKRRLQPYLRYFRGCSNVLDIGCGHGEFLELIGEADIGGYGIDIEADAVQYCADLGLRAERADAIDHLRSLPDDSLDGVLLSQVVEHLQPSELIDLVGLAFRKMMPGGHVVIETPNPQCLLIFASFFYADISHVQPIHPETTRFLLLSAGFREVNIEMTNPVPRSMRLGRIAPPAGGEERSWIDELNSNLEKLNSVLFSHMDYAAVAKK